MLQILHVVLWNACLAAGLAISIFLAQRIRYLRCQPNLWHALWLLVLLKLATPPLFAIPVPMGPTGTEQFQEDHLAASLSIDGQAMPLDGQADETLLTKTTEVILTQQFAVAISALGTIALLLVSLSRIRLIGRLVRHAEPGPQWMQEAGATAARQLKLRRFPSIRTVNGIVAPFLWAAPRGPLVVVPCQLARTLDRESIRLVIKHELAHYARRDHWTNAFSMILGQLFWWNPVVWWARRELRILQESCCDRMVVAADTSQRYRYAEALLRTVEFVASDRAAFPTPATAFGSCATFKRRLEMIVSDTANRLNSRWSQACVLFCAMVVLPLGVVHAQDYDAVTNRIKAAVKAGELTEEHAEAMLHTLKKTVDATKVHAKKPAAKHKKDIDPRLAEFSKKIEAAVKAGVLTKEEAKAKLAATATKVHAKKPAAKHKKDIDPRLAEFTKKIEAAVKAGVLTKEEAKAKLAAIKKAADRDVK